jgi:hypothetical protein
LKYLNYLFKISFIALVAFSFSGCFTKSLNLSKQTSVPSWYINAPANNSAYLYGIGEAYTLEDAKNNALNDMASRLAVSVKSATQSVTKTSTNGLSSSYSKDVTKSLKVDVEKIKFTNAIIEKNALIGKTYYLLMKVDRKKLFKNKKQAFLLNDKRLDAKYSTLKNFSKLEQIKILQSMYSDLIKNKKLAIIINAINNNFDYTKYIAKYDKYIDQISNIKNNLSIKVITNNKEKYFANSLIDLLNQANYKISDQAPDVKIKVDNKVRYSMARGWNIAKVTTTLSVISNNKTISNQIINTIGRSSTSKQSALQNASVRFAKKIKQKSLDKILFP